MKIPNPFKIYSPEGNNFVSFELDESTHSFTIICRPVSLARKLIHFLNVMTHKNNYAINVLLFDKNEVIQIFDTLPLLISITFKPHAYEYTKEESLNNIMQFHQFIDRLPTYGEMN